jgi:integrase
MPDAATADRIKGVADSLKAYSSSYGVNHREKSVLVVENRAAHLERLLGADLLPDLTPERLVWYMKQRLTEGACGRTINIELSVLSRAMGRTWRELWPTLRKMEERRDVGRALSPDEEERLLSAAAKNRSPLVYPFVRMALLTGMRHDEIRLLRWEQIDFEKNEVRVGRAKTVSGTGRVIPIGPRLRAVLSTHATWYSGIFGPLQPNWYVFPKSQRIRPVDPDNPVTSLKTAWWSVCETAAVDCRFHDLRHTVCTKMAEAGVPESTMLDIMGHMSTAMLRRYSHIRQVAKREAIEAIEKNSPGQRGVKVYASEGSERSVTH